MRSVIRGRKGTTRTLRREGFVVLWCRDWFRGPRHRSSITRAATKMSGTKRGASSKSLSLSSCPCAFVVNSSLIRPTLAPGPVRGIQNIAEERCSCRCFLKPRIVFHVTAQIRYDCAHCKAGCQGLDSEHDGPHTSQQAREREEHHVRETGNGAAGCHFGTDRRI